MNEPVDRFGEPVAEHYDETSDAMFDPAVVDPAVDVLAELADGGRALELGIGTGRIALPLAARGVEVAWHRAVASDGRAAPGEAGRRRDPRHDRRLHERDRGGAGTFRLAYLVFNTIMNVTSQAGAGRRLPERRGAPRARWAVRHRGRWSRTSGDCRPVSDTSCST